MGECNNLKLTLVGRGRNTYHFRSFLGKRKREREDERESIGCFNSHDHRRGTERFTQSPFIG
jgi:hypothetical protein